MKNKKNTLILATLTVAFLAFFAQRGNAAGELDYGFANNGKATSYVSNLEQMNRIAELDGGGFLVAGHARQSIGYRLILRRHHSHGYKDTSFGKNGDAFDPTRFGPNINARDLSEIVVQPDGAILVAGERRSNTNGSFLGYSLWRFTANGALDKTFGGVGRIDLAGSVLALKVMSVQNINSSVTKILVLHKSPQDRRLTRFNLDGSIDNAFGSQGSVMLTNEHLLETYPGGFAVGGDYIYVAGGTYSSRTVSRYQANGSLSLDFGAGGTASINPCDSTNIIERLVQIKVQRDQTILFLQATPAHTPYVQLGRLTSEGDCDAGFQRPPPYWNPSITPQMDVQSDGKIIVNGLYEFQGDNSVMRVFPNGVKDYSYQAAERIGSFFIQNGTDKLISLEKNENSYIVKRLLP